MNTKLIVIGVISIIIIIWRFRAIFKKKVTGVNLPKIHLPHGLIGGALFWGAFLGSVAWGTTHNWPIGGISALLLGFLFFRFIVIGDVPIGFVWITTVAIGLITLVAVVGANGQKSREALEGFIGRHITSFERNRLRAELVAQGRLRSSEGICWKAELLCSSPLGVPDSEWTSNYDTEIVSWSSSSFMIKVKKGYDREFVILVGDELPERSDRIKGSWILKSPDGEVMAKGEVSLQHRSIPFPSSNEEIRGVIIGVPEVPSRLDHRIDLNFFIRPSRPYRELLKNLWD